ncbi:polyphosphate kinase 1 [Dyadobacter sp. CY323]|uniref:polyphosphate kinase 1 n=1 Tax=Dyadobacter sp. CY323 TaxID=2907302 RepID=UPI001F2DED70|nr:polyphosphate kinase 1 [Dyadobacter sp. CY323]MCE6987958.1 polyphosphate kinase 1 [Dyadobacter sp. CY323]
MAEYRFFDRDISWLSFNERVLMEAEDQSLPLMERIRFLSIYSSNLDEFYRVRMPVLQKKAGGAQSDRIFEQASSIIDIQQNRYGEVLVNSIIPELDTLGFHFCYREKIPDILLPRVNEYFFSQVAGLMQPVFLDSGNVVFPENNMLYLAVILNLEPGGERLALVNVPTNHISRFYKVRSENQDYILFLEDIIKQNLKSLFPTAVNIQAYNIKVTRDAELDLVDEDGEDITEKFEKQLNKRDLGYATRFLYQPGLPPRHLKNIIDTLDLKSTSVVAGGEHHNLKDLASLPIWDASLSYPRRDAVNPLKSDNQTNTLFEKLADRDILVHPPYQRYDTVLRFFNEAAIDPTVQEIYTTMYRVAHDSKIALALISAARNGKQVTVLLELKARFDEANNIHWGKKMKSAGVKIVHSVNALKIHAKLALVKRKHETLPFLGLFATGNLNESTARFYTDHVLLTANQPMLAESERLFLFLRKKKKPEITDVIPFQHLLVAQFNLQTRFLALIDREIAHANQGLPSGITIKLNNLEEEVMISKLYEASNAGVQINLIVRSICRIVPGLPTQSEHITVRRIVDRYLEHGRVFIFHNNGAPEIFMGSTDWMNRNIYRRIEVCFPIYDDNLKHELMHLISLQMEDTAKAVLIDRNLTNKRFDQSEKGVASQEAIYQYLSGSASSDH